MERAWHCADVIACLCSAWRFAGQLAPALKDLARGRILRFLHTGDLLNKRSVTVRVPVHTAGDFARVRRLWNSWRRKLHQNPDVAALLSQRYKLVPATPPRTTEWFDQHQAAHTTPT